MKGLNFLLLKETLQVINKNATNMGVILLASPGRDESLICFSFLKITCSHNTDFSSTRSKIDSSCLSLTVNKCYQPGVATRGRGRQVFIYLLILGQARTGIGNSRLPKAIKCNLFIYLFFPFAGMEARSLFLTSMPPTTELYL